MICEDFENSDERLIRMLPDDELSVQYCEKWGIVGEYVCRHYAFCDDDGNEVDLSR